MFKHKDHAKFADLIGRMNSDCMKNGIDTLTFGNGTVYEGRFQEGMFEDEGTLKFEGVGDFHGKWKQGRLLQGKLSFQDGLAFKRLNWDYCHGADRRFWSETHSKQMKVQDYPKLANGEVSLIPPATYDVGDGYLDTSEDAVFGYDGIWKRNASLEETSWAVAKCRIGTSWDGKKPAAAAAESKTDSKQPVKDFDQTMKTAMENAIENMELPSKEVSDSTHCNVPGKRPSHYFILNKCVKCSYELPVIKTDAQNVNASAPAKTDFSPRHPPADEPCAVDPKGKHSFLRGVCRHCNSVLLFWLAHFT